MSSPHDITVVIIDRHWIVAEGLAQVLRLESDIDVVGVATNVGEGFELVSRHLPDVVVVDEELHDGQNEFFEATARFASVSGTSRYSFGGVPGTRRRHKGAGRPDRRASSRESIHARRSLTPARAVAEHSPILPPLDTAGLGHRLVTDVAQEDRATNVTGIGIPSPPGRGLLRQADRPLSRHVSVHTG